jgi:quercetin dioxygenase-like cupin family protein
MRTTIFHRRGDGVGADVATSPDWRPFKEYDGRPLARVKLVELIQPPRAELQLVEIATRGHFTMHSSPDLAFCQIVRGKGKLGLPDGIELYYEGPELYVFLPGTLHDWHDVEQDTLLSVCLVKQQ